jgi:TonB family protein
MSLNNKNLPQLSAALAVGAQGFGKSAGQDRLRAFHVLRSMIPFAVPKSPTSMRSLTHALNIGTLALWMSVAGFGSLGAILGKAAYVPVVTNESGIDLVHTLEVESIESADTLSETAKDLASSETLDLPAPPEMLPAFSSEALPEVPEMANTETKKISIAINKPVKVASKASEKNQKTSAVTNNTSAIGSTTMSNAARLAAGRMPAPRYPLEARNKGQTGTVLIEFTIDPSGRVSSAHVAAPCPWSLLNQEALRAVKNWKFPPGSAMTYKKPIVFKLQNS